LPLCAARFYIFESAFFLIFEVRLFSARGDAHIERFIFSLPAYRLAFRLAVRSPRVFCVRLRTSPPSFLSFQKLFLLRSPSGFFYPSKIFPLFPVCRQEGDLASFFRALFGN